ncbi:MAG: hypothetical protein JWR60_3597, partial [Polaromonas sp.]|nr:hypothetical protein [Polaromonas sp.]
MHKPFSNQSLTLPRPAGARAAAALACSWL